MAEAKPKITQLRGLGSSASLDTGLTIGKVIVVADVGGQPGFPALDASGLTNVPGGAVEVVNGSYTGSIDGSNTVFTVANSYVATTVKVLLNGLRQDFNEDTYEETDPEEGIITLTTAPLTGDSLSFDYLSADSVGYGSGGGGGGGGISDAQNMARQLLRI